MDEVIALLKNISKSLDSIDSRLIRIESNTSGTESNTGDIYYVKNELEEINTGLKKLKK
ncbi:hypothetical protein [Candidatus Galacturonibacter soehngenii]|uniref:hypothetical protein n=1 Tax=Candidatus Galacturonatibacter soehngenii TaxID=2307010 RepID=UPI00177AD6BC|nr:hypothetical protein [Candidatus Galacturonibacter soehngenii]